MIPTVCRIVIYRLERAHRQDVVDRPAIVVATEGSKVNLIVFLDMPDDLGPDRFASTSDTRWKGSVLQDDTGKTPGTWRWPPRA